ncbi:MAG TPA: TonB-dependent receptor, partial [Salinimicrobium sp.]|nr:TonB-dependent receptor [Salinimicrobium sp.]
MKKLLLIFVFFLAQLSIVAQELSISGVVSLKGDPVAGAAVVVRGTQKGTTTDQQGFYRLNLEKGSYVLIFSYGNKKEIKIKLDEDLILNVDLANAKEVLDKVFISAVRVDADSPITHSNLTGEEIANRNLGQDIPVLMNYMPSVVTTSDAGAGVGYTSIRVRGSSAINVTINGIPYNDSESQGTFWVNLGDFASSTESLQLQRGVGSSTNGAGAFGASINILTTSHQNEASAKLSSSIGSFNTSKNTLELHTGIINDHWGFYARASKIESDGYIDRAASDLKSYFLQGSYVDENSIFKALAFGGKEVTYQAWFGITAERLQTDRTYNPAGKYTDAEGNIKFYQNQTDNYQQDHYQLLWNEEYNRFWSSNIALHFTYGRGYYEEYEEDAALVDFGLEPFIALGSEVTTSDLVNRSWLENYFYGTVFSLNYKRDNISSTIGGGLNRYIGDHFGEVIYTGFARNRDPYEPFYFNTGYKTDFNIFGKTTWAVSDDLAVFADMQLRTIDYRTEGPLADGSELLVDDEFLFFNPKAGLTYQVSKKDHFYLSYAKAHREPNRSDYENGNPVPEELDDYELGWRHETGKFSLNSNIYYMRYQNQFVLTGAIDEEGAPIRENSGNSYRLGLELHAAAVISP